ncbi:hypothetical protein RJT34_26006 [Clitoria ternatea]|uniref:Uncharacterized protein n=1 Tax=Clitoria ternatea TaxID=43366 RepID=A0AAN9FF33_CLITE
MCIPIRILLLSLNRTQRKLTWRTFKMIKKVLQEFSDRDGSTDVIPQKHPSSSNKLLWKLETHPTQLPL